MKTLRNLCLSVLLVACVPLFAHPRTVCVDGETQVLILSNRDYGNGLQDGEFTAGACPAPEPPAPPEPRPPVSPPSPPPPPPQNPACTRCPQADPTPVNGDPYKTCTSLIFPDFRGPEFSLGVISNIGSKRGACWSDKLALSPGYTEPMTLEEFQAPEGFRGVVRVYCDFDAVGIHYSRIFAHAGLYAIVAEKKHRQTSCPWE